MQVYIDIHDHNSRNMGGYEWQATYLWARDRKNKVCRWSTLDHFDAAHQTNLIRATCTRRQTLHNHSMLLRSTLGNDIYSSLFAMSYSVGRVLDRKPVYVEDTTGEGMISLTSVAAEVYTCAFSTVRISNLLFCVNASVVCLQPRV